MTTDEILEPDAFSFLRGAKKYRVKAAKIEYARIHVKKALEAATYKIDLYYDEHEEILNAYPESNLK